MRTIGIILGIVLAAIGGAIAYRALFLDYHTTVVITNSGVREVPNLFRAVGGIALLLLGAILAFFSARKKRA